MRKPSRSKAEALFTATGKKANQYLKAKEKDWQEKMDRMAKLRALRLAKAEETSAKETSGQKATKKQSGKTGEASTPEATE